MIIPHLLCKFVTILQLMKKVNSIILILAAACACQQYTVTEHEGYDVLSQRRGPALGYSDVDIMYVDGRAFKDLNRNGQLDVYEDWRQTPQERAKDLVSQMPVEYLSGILTNGHTVNVPGYSSMSVSEIGRAHV